MARRPDFYTSAFPAHVENDEIQRSILISSLDPVYASPRRRSDEYCRQMRAILTGVL